MTGSVHLGDLSWTEVRAVLDGPRSAVALLPLGVVEPHGPHAPLATDTIISLGICERAARAFADDPTTVALVLPPVTYGITRYASAFPGTIGLAPETLAAVLVDVCRGAADTGLHRIVVVNNHFEPAQVETIRKVTADLAGQNAVKLAYLDLTRRANAARLGDEFASGSCHAGRYETSLVLAERPELVDAEVMSRLEPLVLPMHEAIAAGRTDFLALGMNEAYCGAPADATTAEGEERFDVLAQMLIDVIRDVVED
ncbi:MAG: creatininase family protein [Actinomycetota bacterium]|nr:creatininase family protein [Actinomycetota bacterium]